MVDPIARRPEQPASSNPYRWMLLGCELLTLAALVANLVAMAPR
jgi:hypothetical protein